MTPGQVGQFLLTDLSQFGPHPGRQALLLAILTRNLALGTGTPGLYPVEVGAQLQTSHTEPILAMVMPAVAGQHMLHCAAFLGLKFK